MKTFVSKGIAVLLVCLCTFFVADAQDKKVTVLGIHVDGKVVKTRYSVELTSAGKHYDLRTEAGAFFLPEDNKLDEWVDVVIRFKKHVLEFHHLHSSNFNTDWVIGVDRPPYSAENLKGKDPRDVLSCYYLEFPSEEPGRKTTVVITRNK